MFLSRVFLGLVLILGFLGQAAIANTCPDSFKQFHVVKMKPHYFEQGKENGIEYLVGERREKFAVTIKDGLFVDEQGQPIETSEIAMFVVDGNGKLFVFQESKLASRELSRFFHHSS